MGNCTGGFKGRKRKLLHHKKVSDKFRKIRICVLGVDGAGKSTVLCALMSGEMNDVLPTNGFTLREFKCGKAEIIAYDLGGDKRIRSIWNNYYPEVFGVIYVVDGSERDRIEESGQLLKDVISEKNLNNKPFLVILNKKDRERYIDEIQFTDRFNLHCLANRYRTQIRVEICQSNAGTGRMIDVALKDGFEWLLEEIYNNYDMLAKRVNEALEKLKRQQDEERIRRQHHLAATVSSSSDSEEEKRNNDDAVVEPAAETAESDEHSSQKTNTKQKNNLEIVNEPQKLKKFLHNMINPADDLPLPSASTDAVVMKNPQIFEVPSPISKKTVSVQTDGTFDINGDMQSTSKATRIVNLIPISAMPKERPKPHYRPFRWKTDPV